MAKQNEKFMSMNAQLLGLSVDSNTSHLAWVYIIYKNTGIEIPFPIISDRDMSISKEYGMISPTASETSTVRNVFFIDESQIIRAILVYPLENGRNIYEMIRLLEALQTADRYKVATPANWWPGDPVVVPPPQTYQELLERLENKEGYCCVDWYLCYKEIY